MSAPTSHRTRMVAGLFTAALALAPLTACAEVSSGSVSCSGASCSLTLSGNGATAKVLGNTIAYAGTADGQATLTVAGHSASCTQGQSVSAGPLRLACTTVTDKSVEFTASLG